MKKIILIFLFSYSGIFIYAQKIVNNNLLIDIDDYDQADTLMPKYKLSALELYECTCKQTDKDSCALYWRKRYDLSGRMIEQVKGSDLKRNKIDFIVQYRRLSDTTYESITKYPFSSRRIPDNIFTDTVIKGEKKRICIYKKDKEQSIVVRSVYHINSDHEIGSIKRFDLANNLIEIYYPQGNRKPEREWTDSLIGKSGDTLIYNSVYPENRYKAVAIYDKKGELLEKSDLNINSADGSNDFSKIFFAYDAGGHLVIRTTVDRSGRLVTEERFYYRGNTLIRYTKDDDIADGFLNEEKSYDGSGNLIFYQSRGSAAESTYTWKYFINDKGLPEKRESYMNDKLVSTLIYSYK